MSHLRGPLVSSLHSSAEIAAVPFSHVGGFELALHELRPDFRGATGRLWSRVEEEVRGRTGLPLEALLRLRDLHWFPRGSSLDHSLVDVLEGLARSSLEASGAVARPLGDDRLGRSSAAAQPIASGRSRTAWRWISLALPPELLLASLGGESPPSRVEVLPSTLARDLSDRGYSELHLHLGAAVQFPSLWIGLLHRLADRHRAPWDSARAYDEPVLGVPLASWLLRAALARWVLASFLASPSYASLGQYLEDLRKDADGDLLERCAVQPLLQPESFVPTRCRYEDPLLRRIYRSWIARSAGTLAEGAGIADPLAHYYPGLGPTGPTVETQFAWQALGRIRARPSDVQFATLFWQVQRLRCLLYRSAVHSSRSAGLLSFQRTYDTSASSRRGLKMVDFLQAALDACGWQHGGLRSIELRTSPPRCARDLLQMLVGLEEGIALTERRGEELCLPALPEVGLILHFNKSRRQAASRAPLAAHPSTLEANPGFAGYRYARLYRQKRREARAIGKVLLQFPRALTLLRGLDLASDELGVANWVFLPLFEHVRRCADHAARHLGWSGSPDAMLRTTIHVGEDFVHLQTGLRAISWTLDAFDLSAGDRLGHAIALGLDVGDWAQRSGLLALSVEERLLDLLWEWQWTMRTGTGDAARSRYLEHEIYRLADFVFGERVMESVQVRHLVEMTTALNSVEALAWAAYPDGPAPDPAPGDIVGRLLLHYLCDPQVFQRGCQLEIVDPSLEGPHLERLQEGLRRRVAGLGIAVEIHPSSNLLIGDLGDFSRHPLWRLDPPDAKADAIRVPVCIGSDDPLQFGTGLREEYAYVHDSLLRAGLSEVQAHAWLDRARGNSVSYRFTHPACRRAGIRSSRLAYPLAFEGIL